MVERTQGNTVNSWKYSRIIVKRKSSNWQVQSEIEQNENERGKKSKIQANRVDRNVVNKGVKLCALVV